MKYTVYALKCPLLNQIKYIGLTTNVKVRYQIHVSENKESLKCIWISDLKEKSMRPIIIEIAQFINKEIAKEYERFLISKYSNQLYNHNSNESTLIHDGIDNLAHIE